MAFKLLLLRGERHETAIIDELVDAVAELNLDIEVHVANDDAQADPWIAEIDAAFGYFSPSMIERAKRLRWLACPQAGPDPSFFHQTLIDSPVEVTNVRGIFSDHITAHIMSFVLAFSRGLPEYFDRQRLREWRGGARTVYLPEATAVIVGVGAIGAETAKRCADFSMRVVGVDPRVDVAPEGIDEMIPPDRLLDAVALGDFVIVTVPETPDTQGFFGKNVFDAMRSDAFFINIGRGRTVRIDDLNTALRSGAIAGAALDVFEIEPLPAEHPLWDAPGMVITPHVATIGPYLDERRVSVFVENCRRFASGEPLQNVVDKAAWH